MNLFSRRLSFLRNGWRAICYNGSVPEIISKEDIVVVCWSQPSMNCGSVVDTLGMKYRPGSFFFAIIHFMYEGNTRMNLSPIANYYFYWS